jgi:hypothetical protein
VVVVDPDKVVVRADDLHDLVRKVAVGMHVRLPEGAVKARAVLGGEGQHVVEEGPQVLLAEAVVEAGADVLGQEDRDEVELLQQESRHLGKEEEGKGMTESQGPVKYTVDFSSERRRFC